MRYILILTGLVSLVISGCLIGEPGSTGEVASAGGALSSTCASDDDCAEGSICDTSECLSCCPPGTEVCIALCCGQCTRPRPSPPCAQILCAAGYEPVCDPRGCCHACRPVRGEPCGPVTCPAGQVCCNESCGICTEPGGFCIQIACESR